MSSQAQEEQIIHRLKTIDQYNFEETVNVLNQVLSLQSQSHSYIISNGAFLYLNNRRIPNYKQFKERTRLAELILSASLVPGRSINNEYRRE